MARRHLAVVVVALAVALTGCGGGGSAAEESAEESTTTTTIDLRSEGVLIDIAEPIKELEAELGGPLRIVGSSLASDVATVQVRQPEDPTKVDSFVYRDGSWNPGQPVELKAKDVEELDERTYLSTQVDWAAVAASGPPALALFDDVIEEPLLDGASLVLNEGVVGATLSVSGLRGKGVVRVDAATGTIIDSQRN